MNKLLLFFVTITSFSLFSQVLINPTTNGGFETGATFAANGWTSVNGAQTNKWFLGNPGTVAATGTRAAYISDNGGGTTYNYSITNASVVHFYRDVVFPAGQTDITLTFNWKGQGESTLDYLKVFLVPTGTTPVAGTLLATGQVGGTFNLQAAYQGATIKLPCSAAGTTQRLVFTWRNDASIGIQPPNAIDNISLVAAPATFTNDECTGAITLPVSSFGVCSGAAPYSVICATASAQANACSGTADDDQWFRFTATSSTHFVNLTNLSGSTTDMYFSVYGGTCGALGAPLLCSDPESGSVSGLTIGNVYFIRVFTYTSTTGQTTSFNVCVQEPPSCPGALGIGNVNIPSLPYNVSGQTTCGAVNNQTTTNVPTCGSSSYFSDEDQVYSFTAPSTGSVSVSINSTQSWTSVNVFQGCPFSGTCVGVNQSSASGIKSLCIGVIAGQTYYVVVDGFGTSGSCITTFSLDISAVSAGPSNDLPCNAVTITPGVQEFGNNSCATSVSEFGTPTCFTTGTINSVWFSFVATSATMTVKTTLGTLAGTQVAVYSGACGTLAQLVGACNDNEGNCGSTAMNSSILNLTGLSIGTTYRILVDGDLDLQGTFGINVQNTGTPFPPVQGQDCISPNPVCAAGITASDPGYQGIGAYCDVPSTYCLSSAERGSVWYSFTTNGAGNINFDIIPNNWPGAPSTSGADYDFALWRMGGAVTCATILAGTSTPLKCNYNNLGVTGLNAGGNAPGAYPGFDAAYESQLGVAAGETYYLLINNHSTSIDGFTINFSGASPIDYTGAPTTVSWTGGASTAWNNATNWGSCAFPNCGINAVVNTFAVQPTVVGTMNVRDLTINIGATLTLAAGSTLNVCGNFVNNGTIIASPTSSIVMVGSANQTMTGNFIGTSTLGNFTVNKAAATGSVTTNDDVSMSGNFLTSNVNSIFNSNGKYIRLGGNFTNNNGNTTFTNTGTLGTLEFNGTGTQMYNQGTSQLDLNFVVMNNAGLGTDLLTNMFIKAGTGTLTLTNGKIRTNAFRVDVANGANASVTPGNTTSYVFGNLHRTLNGAIGAYDFPMGTTSLYERANINFTTTTTIPRLQSRFDAWGAPVLHTNGMAECFTTYNIADENMGFWTINASANPTSGTYNTTLYCTGATNTAGVSGWTVEKSSDAGVTWVLSGTCDGTSTAAIVKRNGMNGFSIFAAAQASVPLPIQLLNFNGYAIGRENFLSWKTQSESNSYKFIVEKSIDGENFNAFTELEAAGNSTSLIDYSTIDENPYFPTTYYRLKQVDLDGNYEYSGIIEISNAINEKLTVNALYPNPTNGQSNVNFSLPKTQNVFISVRDASGKIVYQRQMEGVQNNSISLPSDVWSSGLYLIQINSEFDGETTVKLTRE